MENYNNNTNPENQQTLTLKDMWGMCISRWWWFVIAVGVCLLAAVLYIMKTPPVYSRSASVLIKEGTRSRSSYSGDISDAFTDLGFGQARVNTYNEIINFSSPDLMMEVVKRLNLETEYKKDGRFYDRTLYGSSLPIRVEFPDLANNQFAALTVINKGNGQLLLEKFTLNKDKFRKESVLTALGDTTETPVGRVVITEVPYHNGEFDEIFDRPIHITRSGIQSAQRRFSNSMSVALSDKMSTVINLTVQDVNPQRAVEILNTVMNVYNEIWIKDKNLISASTNEFINERLKVIEAELGDVDSSISTFKSEHRLPNIITSAQQDMQLSAEANRNILELNNQLSIARYIMGYIRDAENKLLPANAGLQEANIQSQITQYNTSLLQRNRLVEISSEESLLVKDLDQQLSSIKSAILTSINNYIVSLETQLAAFRSAQSKADARISSNPQQAGQLLSDERQQKVKEALYLFLLQKREENELSQAFTAYNTRVVATPGGSSNPIAPRRNMILLVALVLGLMIPFGILYLMEILNTTVRGRHDLENMKVPFIGELPAAYRHKKTLREIVRHTHEDDPNERQILVKKHSRNVINEAFRVIRTNIEFMRGKPDGKAYVIMTTSMNPGSGKTFTSANIAAAFAVKGKKVLLVDLDLRKKSLSQFVVKDPKAGVADYLNARVDDFRSLVVPSEYGMDVLPVGTMPPNPAELLAEPRLDTLIEALRSDYDYIILDCPPVEIVTDADLIKRLADSTIFIVRAGLLERTMLPVIDKYYTDQKYHNMALLLNGTDGGGRYGYRYGYKYGYHYGYQYGYRSNYGYGQDKEEEKTEA